MPNRRMTVSRSVVIAADAMTVYRYVSDPRETARWSPENTGARLDSPTGSFVVGSTFVGSNKRNAFRWVTRCTVTEAVPGAVFAFRVGQIGVREPKLTAPIADWAYRLRTVDGGTEVTEQWRDLRASWPDPVARVFDYVVTRGSTFVDFNTRNIDSTLAGLKRIVENAAD